MSRRYLVRSDGDWVRDTLGRLVKFTQTGAHRWAARHKPQSYSVVLLDRPAKRAHSSEPGQDGVHDA